MARCPSQCYLGGTAWPPGWRSPASPHNKPQGGGHAPRSRVKPRLGPGCREAARTHNPRPAHPQHSACAPPHSPCRQPIRPGHPGAPAPTDPASPPLDALGRRQAPLSGFSPVVSPPHRAAPGAPEPTRPREPATRCSGGLPAPRASPSALPGANKRVRWTQPATHKQLVGMSRKIEGEDLKREGRNEHPDEQRPFLPSHHETSATQIRDTPRSVPACRTGNAGNTCAFLSYQMRNAPSPWGADCYTNRVIENCLQPNRLTT